MKNVPSSKIRMPFSEAALPVTENLTSPQEAKKTSPVCVRFTEAERAQLEAEAGETALSTHIRDCLFDNNARDRARRYRKKRRYAEPDTALIAKLLGMMGQDDMVKALFALLVAAESDRVAMSDEVQASLDRACSQIDEMRDMLVLALGVKPQSQHGRR